MTRIREIWRSWSVRRRVLTILIPVVVIAGGAIAAYLALKRPGDVFNPNAEFEEPVRERRERDRTVDWPLYGFDPARTKYLPAKGVEPPFRQIWSWDSEQLIEFGPIVVDGVLYGMNNDALFFALDGETGKVLWKKQPGRLNASTPAYAKGVLYAVNLEPAQVFALRAKDGKRLWQRDLPGRSESSPVVQGGTVYFGSEGGNVFALDAKTGKTKWQTSTAGDVKAAPALVDGTLYVGDYAGEMYAIDAKSGEIQWAASDQGSGFGRSGRFYATPAVAFGRVYVGNVDGRVYSYEADDGTLAWSHSAGDYVYSGVVAVNKKGIEPTVFFGSHDGNAYALDARTGEERWVRDLGGIVSGAGAVIGDLFYVSTLAGFTYGLDLRNGKEVYRFEKGEYNPAISDGERLYITGYSSINALEPKTRREGKDEGEKARSGGGSGGGKPGPGKG